MKKGVMILSLLVFSLAIVSAVPCDLSVSLLNQDPYPAVPGDYVKLVFQVSGITNTECGDLTFNLQESYPIEFDPGETGRREFKKIDYVTDYGSNILIPFEVRIDGDALDGSNPIDVNFKSQGDAPLSSTLNLEIDDSRAEFEVYVKDYNFKKHELTLEILNIDKSDVEALTVSIPKQTNAIIKGPNRVVVGDLDSNEYTTADFEAVMMNGEVTVDLTYSDSINVRRSTTKTITFDSEYFTDRIADQKTISKTVYISWGVVILLVLWWIVAKIIKKKKKRRI